MRKPIEEIKSETQELFKQLNEEKCQNKYYEIRNKIVELNQFIICSFAREYSNKNKNIGEYEDFYSEGLIALINAVEKFDTTRNIMFSTYAVTSIIRRYTRMIYEQGLVKKSVNVYRDLNKINNYINDYDILNGTKPNKEQIKTYLNMSEEQYKKSIILEQRMDPVSLNNLINEEIELTNILYKTSDSINYKEIENKEIVETILQILTKRELNVIKKRMQGLTLKQIGDQQGCTRESIRQVELKALNKMRAYLERLDRTNQKEINQKTFKKEPIQKTCEEHDISKRKLNKIYKNKLGEKNEKKL